MAKASVKEQKYPSWRKEVRAKATAATRTESILSPVVGFGEDATPVYQQFKRDLMKVYSSQKVVYLWQRVGELTASYGNRLILPVTPEEKTIWDNAHKGEQNATERL